MGLAAGGGHVQVYADEVQQNEAEAGQQGEEGLDEELQGRRLGLVLVD